MENFYKRKFRKYSFCIINTLYYSFFLILKITEIFLNKKRKDFLIISYS